MIRHAPRESGRKLESGERTIVGVNRAYSTLGEMRDALRDVWVEYEEGPSV